MLYPKDPSINVERSEDAITFRWKRPVIEAKLALSIPVIFMAMAVLVAFLPSDSSDPTPAWQILLAFFLFTSPLTYIGIALLVNTSELTADKSNVTFTSGPMPQFRSKQVSSVGAKQFFALKAETASTGHYRANAVYVIDGSDHVHLVVASLPSTFAANQICHELEDFYGIEDMEVYGVTTAPEHPGPRPSR